VARLAASRACDLTDALPDLRPPGRVDGVAGTFVGVEGRRAAGAAPGGGRAAAAEPKTEAGLGRPGDARRPGPAPPQAAAAEPASNAGHAAALAPAADPLALDLSTRGREAADRCQARGGDRADGAREPGLGLPAHPRRTTWPGYPRRRLDGAASTETAADTACPAAKPVHLAAVHPNAGLDHARLRLLPRRLRGHLAPRVRVLRHRTAAAMSMSWA